MILLNYPKYVGGKFISNCLALSRYCVVQEKQLAMIDLNTSVFDEKYYQAKLASVLKSLPNKTQLKMWLQFEYGCDRIYDVNEDFYKEKSIQEIKDYISTNEIIKLIISKGRKSCLITHDYQTLLKYLIVHTNAFVIEFNNFDKFRKTAALLKDHNPAHIGDEDWVTGRNFYHNMRNFYQLNSFIIDVDNTFMEWYPFNQMMQNLYEYLGFDDYNAELTYKFWVEYTNLHR